MAMSLLDFDLVGRRLLNAPFDAGVPSRARALDHKAGAASDAVTLLVFYRTKPIKFEKCKAGIAVHSKEKLPAVIDALIEAAREGELDDLMPRMNKPVGD